MCQRDWTALLYIDVQLHWRTTQNITNPLYAIFSPTRYLEVATKTVLLYLHPPETQLHIQHCCSASRQMCESDKADLSESYCLLWIQYFCILADVVDTILQPLVGLDEGTLGSSLRIPTVQIFTTAPDSWGRLVLWFNVPTYVRLHLAFKRGQ